MRPGFSFERQGLAPLTRAAALCLLELNGRRYCLAASGEETGSCVLIGLEKGNYFPVQPLDGRILSMAAAPGRAGAFLAVRRQGEETALLLGQIIPQMEGGMLQSDTLVLLRQHGLSRICLVGGHLLAVGGEDGTLYELSLTPELTVAADPNPLMPGLGAVSSLTARESPEDGVQVLVTAAAGSFVLTLQEDSLWMIQKLPVPQGGSGCWCMLEDQAMICHSLGGVLCRRDGRWQPAATEAVPGQLLCGGEELVYAALETGALALYGLQKTAEGIRVRELLTEPDLSVQQLIQAGENSFLAAVSGENRVDRLLIL